MYLLPNFQPGAKRTQAGSEVGTIYSPLTEEDKSALAEGFLKFIELSINRVRRPTSTPKKGSRVQASLRILIK